MIFFDLDGVIRELDAAIWKKQEVKYWDQPCPNGQNIFDYVKDNIDVLLKSPPSKYCKIIRKFNPVILSSQPEDWRPNTTTWIKNNCPECSKIIYVSKPEEKLEFLKDKDWLVEDYPKFDPEVYLTKKILLIDKSYNRNVIAKFRIRSPFILNQVLVTLLNLEGKL